MLDQSALARHAEPGDRERQPEGCEEDIADPNHRPKGAHGADREAENARRHDAPRFPAIAAVLAAGVFEAPDDQDPDAEFNFGLERILDGVAALLRKR